MSTEEIIQRTRLLDSEIKVGSQPPWRTAKPPQDRPWRSIPVASFTLFSAFAGRHRARGLEKGKRKLSLKRDPKRDTDGGRAGRFIRLTFPVRSLNIPLENLSFRKSPFFR